MCKLVGLCKDRVNALVPCGLVYGYSFRSTIDYYDSGMSWASSLGRFVGLYVCRNEAFKLIQAGLVIIQ